MNSPQDPSTRESTLESTRGNSLVSCIQKEGRIAHAKDPPVRVMLANEGAGNILVATDFGEVSDQAVAEAAQLALQRDSTLTILHVIDIGSRMDCGTAAGLMERLWAKGTSDLELRSRALKAQGIKVRTQIIEGLPAEVIVELSAGFDLLVIGKRRSKPFWNFFSRNTVRRVVEGAQCSVRVVQPGPGEIRPEFNAGSWSSIWLRPDFDGKVASHHESQPGPDGEYDEHRGEVRREEVQAASFGAGI